MIKGKKGVLNELGSTLQTLAFLGILGAIFLVVLISLNSTISMDSSTITNETITITANFAGTPANATYTLAHTNLQDIIAITNSSNYVGILHTDYNFTNGALASAGTIQLWNITNATENMGMFTGIADKAPTHINVTYTYGTNSQANNAILNTTGGINNTFAQFPLFGTILGLLLIVSIVFLLVRSKGNKSDKL